MVQEFSQVVAVFSGRPKQLAGEGNIWKVMHVLLFEPLSTHEILVHYKHIGAIPLHRLNEAHLQSVSSARSKPGTSAAHAVGGGVGHEHEQSACWQWMQKRAAELGGEIIETLIQARKRDGNPSCCCSQDTGEQKRGVQAQIGGCYMKSVCDYRGEYLEEGHPQREAGAKGKISN